MKKTNAITIGVLIIGSAIIWGAVIIGAAIILKGTPYKESIIKLLYGGVVTHLVLIWGPIALSFKQAKEQKNTEDKK